jgi:LuxR family quorum-sensing system transcriptional regulator CciR
LKAAADAGIAQGFTVPINVPGEPPASCSFGLREGRKMPEEALLATLWVAKFGFEQARRILGLAPSLAERPRLSPRQHDCLLWIARGKTDGELATILGLSRETVHGYVQAAMRRHRVYTRQQLLAACLADGQLTFAGS